MKRICYVILLALMYQMTRAQSSTLVEPKDNFICSSSPEMFHHNERCANILPCTGGKVKKIKDPTGLKPCRKCSWPKYIDAGFVDIKRVMGVRDRRQIIDSLGTGLLNQMRYERDGYYITFSSSLGKDGVDIATFRFNKETPFAKRELLSPAFYTKLGLQFGPCRADTIPESDPRRRWNAVPGILIEYRGCAVVEPRFPHEDTTLYYYALFFEEGRHEDRSQSDLRSVRLYLFKDKAQRP